MAGPHVREGVREVIGGGVLDESRHCGRRGESPPYVQRTSGRACKVMDLETRIKWVVARLTKWPEAQDVTLEEFDN